jgi:DNA-binding NtrC family response regulator
MIQGTIKRANRLKKKSAHRNTSYRDPLFVITGPSVLIASEDRQMKSCVAKALEKEGYEVREARCGVDILKRLGERPQRMSSGDPVEILLLDISDNPWAGLALFKSIQRLDWALPVILLHESNDLSFVYEMKKLGAQAVLKKPIQWELLLKEITKASPRILTLASA